MAFNQRFAGLRLREQGVDIDQFEKDFLTAHNLYRKQHGSPPLQLSRELCKSAQKWADHLLSIRTLKHSNTDHGENLYYKYSSSTKELPGREPVDNWYSEIKNYNFSQPGFGGNTVKPSIHLLTISLYGHISYGITGEVTAHSSQLRFMGNVDEDNGIPPAPEDPRTISSLLRKIVNKMLFKYKQRPNEKHV
ncbi:uncharacterized protein O3C94_010616 [Discoglossus pictus]